MDKDAMTEAKKILLATLREFLENELADPKLTIRDIPPILQEVVWHRAEQWGRLDDLRVRYCEEIASLVLDELCQKRFQDICQKLGSVRRRGEDLTSLLLVRTQYLAPLVDGVDIYSGSEAIECLQNPGCLEKVRPSDIPPPLLENVDTRIQGLRDASGQQSGAVSRHRKKGLNILAEAIWEAYEVAVPAMLAVPEPPEPKIPPPSTEYWLGEFAERLQKMHGEPPPEPQPLPIAPEPEEVPDAEEPAIPQEPLVQDALPTEQEALLQEELAIQDELSIGQERLLQEELPACPEEDGDAEIVSRLRQRFPHREIGHLVPRIDILDEVKELLLAENGPAVIGLWGAPGVGKTALLQMLWHDPEVQAHFEFPLWAELGLEVDESLDANRPGEKRQEQLSLWADALSVPNPGLAESIREQLLDWRPLLLLDDAWSGDSVQHLLVGGRAVFTTRNRALLDGCPLGCEMVEIPPMSLAEAQSLVWMVTGQALDLDDPYLHELHEHTDGLPQALRAAAFRIRELGWAQALTLLREEHSRLPLLEQGEGRARSDSLWASFTLSYRRLRPKQQGLLRALGALAPEPASAGAVHAVWQQKTTETTELELRRLADLSLVQTHPIEDGGILFRLSVLWRDYARELLRESEELESFEERYSADQVHRARVLGDRFQATGEEVSQVMQAFHQEVHHFDYVFRLVSQPQNAELLYWLLVSCRPLFIHAGRLDI